MKRYARNLALLAMALACTAGPIRGQEPPLRKHTHSIMHFTPEWVRQHHDRRHKLPVIRKPVESSPSRWPGDTLGANLATNVNFASCGGVIGWDQGACGNCWVFGSTVALSVDDGVASGAPQLFSTQWFDSDFYATNGQSTCGGGDDTSFADWYNSHPKFIPWSNTGAGYADGNGPSAPATPVSSIAQNPFVGIGQISVAQIATSSVSQAEAIANIKYVLDNHQAVVLSFFLPSAGWTDFDNAWDSQSETTPWAGVDTYSGSTMAGGHLVCVVGYDDTDNAWVIQNSWGTTDRRPDGWFELPQAMNYADTIVDGGSFDMWEFDTFVPTGWTNGSTGAPTITTQPASQTVNLGATATFNVVAAGTVPLGYQWSKGGAAISGATSASYTTPPAAATDNGATFQVVVTNAAGSATSSSATLTVTAPVVTNLIVNGGFETGDTSWQASSGVIGQWSRGAAPYAGTWSAWLCGPSSPAGSTSTLSQGVAIPATASQATLAFYLHVNGTADAANGGTFKVRVRNVNGTARATLGAFTNSLAVSGYKLHSFDLGAYRGQTVILSFTGTPGGSGPSRTSFALDNVSLDCR
jgi:C1A family cysteine protease